MVFAKVHYNNVMSDDTQKADAHGNRLVLMTWRIFLRALGLLPLTWVRKLGRGLGALMRWRQVSEYHIVCVNVALCFPELSEAEQAQLARDTLSHTGMMGGETPWIWSKSAERALQTVEAVENEHLFDEALNSDAGLIIAAPHLGNWEILNYYLGSRTPMSILYRPPRKSMLEDTIRAGRHVPGITQIRAEKAGVRQLMKTLQQGGVVGILPDQQPKEGDGVWVDFFGLPALTMTLLPRLAAKTKAQVLLAVAIRTPTGFRIRFEQLDERIQSRDVTEATASMNQAIESVVRTAPAQYQWIYKRFSKRPPGDERRLYGQETYRQR